MAEDRLTKEKPRTAGWVKALLFVSLALNLVIVGIVAGSVIGRDGGKGGDRQGRIGALRDLGPLPFVMAFDKDQRQALASEMRDKTQGNRASRADLRQKVESVLESLRSDSFDPEVVRGSIEQLRAQTQTRQTVGLDLYVDTLAKMTVEERRAYADRLDKLLQRRHRP